MTGDPYENLSDIDIARKIDAFNEKIMANDYDFFWIPTHFFMDAEFDDCLVWVLLEHMREATNSEFNVLVQLPAEAEFDEVADLWNSVPNCEVWRDPNSRNSEALRDTYLQKQRNEETQESENVEGEGKDEAFTNPKQAVENQEL